MKLRMGRRRHKIDDVLKPQHADTKQEIEEIERRKIPAMGFFGRKKKAALRAGTAETEPNNNPAPEQKTRTRQAPSHFVELGTIEYANLTSDSKHGEYEPALLAAKDTGRPIFANFVEWSG